MHGVEMLPLIATLLCASLCVADVDVPEGGLCTTEACMSLTATLVQNANLKANPCDDFYEFACGGFAKNAHYDMSAPDVEYVDAANRMSSELENRLHDIFIDSSLPVNASDGPLKSAVALARSLYSSCLREHVLSNQSASPANTINALLDHLLGNLAVDFESVQLEHLLARTASMGIGTIFSMDLSDEDFKLVDDDALSSELNANVSKLQIVVSTFNYTADPLHWTSMLELLMSKNVTGANRILTSPVFGGKTHAVIAGIAREINATVSSLANASQPFKGSLDELSATLNSLPGFNLTAFLSHLLPSGADGSTVVKVNNMPLLKALLSYFSNVSVSPQCTALRTQRLAFLVLDAMMDFVDLLPACSATLKPRAEHLSWRGQLRNRQCLETAKELMEPAVVWFYHQRYLPASLADVRKMVEATKAATVQKILAQDWISELDKAKMAEKARQVTYQIGHQNFTEKQLDDFYADTLTDVDWSRSSQFGYMLGFAMKSYAKQFIDMLTGRPVLTLVSYLVCPYTTNAFFDPATNRMIFPLGILLPPNYSPGYPDFATYGSFGSTVGHELGHGFVAMWNKTQSGLQLEPQSHAAYLSRVQCLQQQLSQQSEGAYANQTFEEDLADSLSLHAAFSAYLTERTADTDRLPASLSDLLGGCGSKCGDPDLMPQQAERLFFVMAAQWFCTKAPSSVISDIFRREDGVEHSSGLARVHAMMRGSADFARVFDCPTGSAMNPAEKCSIW